MTWPRSPLKAALLAAGLILLTLPARAADAPPKPQTIALIATLGDQLTVVRPKSSRANAVEPYAQRAVQIDGDILNFSVLRGLDSALALEEPESRRVMLRWRANEELGKQIRSTPVEARDTVMLAALRTTLGEMPQRAEWDRIEAILPRYSPTERGGLPRRLVGIGIYVQPVGNQWEQLDEDGADRRKDFDPAAENTTNPRTGERGKDTSFVAPYIYFDRVTLDARTLEVLARKSQYSNSKFSDPKSRSVDVLDDVSPAELVIQLNKLVEKAAYQSVRGKGEVEVGPIREVPKP